MVQSKRAQSIFQVTLKDKDLDKLRKAAGKIAETAADNGGTSVDADTNPVQGFRIRRGGRFGPGGPGGGIVDEPDPIAGPTTEWLATSPAEARREAIRRAVMEAPADAEAATGSTKLTVVEISVTGADDAARALPHAGRRQREGLGTRSHRCRGSHYLLILLCIFG